jgi:hypothetical protein
MVGVVSAVTGMVPLVTGKPDPAMHAECVRRTGARNPLVVGDRLDTDIEGARRAGAASLLVLSGVTDPATLLSAGPEHRPDLLAWDASGVLSAHPAVHVDGSAWRCGRWWVRAAEADDVLILEAGPEEEPGDGLDGLRALCVGHWSRRPETGAAVRVVAADEVAARALDPWGIGADDRP